MASSPEAGKVPLVLCAGIAVIDHVFQLKTFPSTGIKTRADAFVVTGGGCAANAAVAIRRLGARARWPPRSAARRAGHGRRQHPGAAAPKASISRAWCGSKAQLAGLGDPDRRRRRTADRHVTATTPHRRMRTSRSQRLVAGADAVWPIIAFASSCCRSARPRAAAICRSCSMSTSRPKWSTPC